MLARTIAITFLAFYTTTLIYSKIVLDPLGEALWEASPQVPDKQPPIFIPFPGTTKELKPQPYRGRDPEWQEFVKFSRDRDKARRVKGLSPFPWFVLGC
jgi:hypothetical protein